jgi:Ti-type conjugative transfer relaxase TraA
VPTCVFEGSWYDRMAIYHFSAKVISRANGSSALAAAAYRSASRLHDERLDRHHDFSNKAGVVHSEVMLPEGAPEHLGDRATLWNAVEAAELRKDSQLAREVEFALPRELDQAEGIRLARDFVAREFVARGMIADLNVHGDVGADGEPRPHAHVMLTMREIGEDGFGAKVREWNRTELLEHWREAWGSHVNARLAKLDIDARIDHRSLEAQGIGLEPQHKIGAAAKRMAAEGLEVERVADHRAIARANGEKLLATPALALDAITHAQATFTTRDLAMFVHRHSDGQDQFDRVLAAVKAAPELIRVGWDGRGEERFTSRAMLETERRLERSGVSMEARRNHPVSKRDRDGALSRGVARGLLLSPEQRDAFEHVTRSTGLSAVVGYAGTGKSAMLGLAREAWEGAGYHVQGAALSGIAAENLEAGSGIASRTIASLEHQWGQGRDLLTDRHLLVIDEAGMIGTRQMERVLAEAEKRRAKVVLVGDPEQLQAIEAGAAFRSIAERHGAVEITAIRRQSEDWQRDATRHLATGRTGEAIRAYEEHGAVHIAGTRAEARTDLIERWDVERKADAGATRIILTHTNDEVRELNLAARGRLRDAGELGADVPVRTERGQRVFAAGDRIMFLRNERGLGVKNGSLGRIDSVTAARMAVMLDDGRAVAFDLKDYAHVDHGYAATIHKAQGVTVDRTHVLATPGLDRHAAYVALSRHRDGLRLHYGRDDFADDGKLVRTLSRDRPKDMASDYMREFADRRAIVLPQPITPARQLDMFGRLDGIPASPSAGRATSLHQAVVRFARATAEIVKARQQGLSESPSQRSAFDAARHELEAVRPQAARDLRAAFVRDMQLLDEAATGNSRGAIGAMEWERRYRTEPQLRANQFVKSWRELGDRRELFERRGDEAAVQRIATQMAGLAKSLERDPQVESMLRRRTGELGLPPFVEKPLSQALPDWIGWGRGRGLSR